MRVTAFFPSVAAVAIVACIAGAARPVLAQSLVDVSRREEERRKEIKTPAKVYTNKDLGAPPASFATPADPAAAAAAPAPAAPGAADQPKDAGPAKDQKYWSDRKKGLDSKLERDQVLADAMQSRINGLTADFAARADPAQRSVIERDRQRAVAELDSLQKAIKADQQALTDLDEEARKASVPAGWLR
jgi:hypothetical protein